MRYKIHTRGDQAVATVYTTETPDVVEQFNDKERSAIEFTDVKLLDIVIPKENVIRIIRLPEMQKKLEGE